MFTIRIATAFLISARRRFLPLAPAVLAACCLGCRTEMYDQPKYRPYEPSSFFDDGTSARPLPLGTVPRGSVAIDGFMSRGLVNGNPVNEFPFEVTKVHLLRGQQRYNIYCAPCHGQRGDGRGMIVQRGFPPPPPLYGPIPRKIPIEGTPVAQYSDLRDAPAGHFVRVIAEGNGAMYSYASRIQPEDRWNIAAYIRALQLSQFPTEEQQKEYTAGAKLKSPKAERVASNGNTLASPRTGFQEAAQ